MSAPKIDKDSLPKMFWETVRHDAPHPRIVRRAYLRFLTNTRWPARPRRSFSFGCRVVLMGSALVRWVLRLAAREARPNPRINRPIGPTSNSD